MNTKQIAESQYRSNPLKVRTLVPSDAEAYHVVRLLALHEKPPAFGLPPEDEPDLAETAVRL